jgi:hypothetical protein
MISLSKNITFYKPFPHLIFENVFLDDDYQRLCESFPKIEFLKQIQNKEISILKQEKFHLNNIGMLKDFNFFISQNNFYKKLYKYLNTKEFLLNLYLTLEKKYISIGHKFYEKNNFINNFKKILRGHSTNQYVVEFEFSSIPLSGGFIKPHTDGKNKIISLIIPIDNEIKLHECENTGTDIFESVSDQYQYNMSNKTVPVENVKLVRTIPFKKNNMLCLIKTHNSLHGIGPIKNKSQVKNLYRNSLTIFITRK